MAKFAVGDRVRITDGEPEELIGARGKVVVVREDKELGRIGNRPHLEQTYDVEVDGRGVAESVWEEWLTPESG